MPQCDPARQSGSWANTMLKIKRAAIYGRVSTDWQTTDNQTMALTEVAARRGWEVVDVYIDHAISGANKREKRPAFDSYALSCHAMSYPTPNCRAALPPIIRAMSGSGTLA